VKWYSKLFILCAIFFGVFSSASAFNIFGATRFDSSGGNAQTGVDTCSSYIYQYTVSVDQTRDHMNMQWIPDGSLWSFNGCPTYLVPVDMFHNETRSFQMMLITNPVDACNVGLSRADCILNADDIQCLGVNEDARTPESLCTSYAPPPPPPPPPPPAFSFKVISTSSATQMIAGVGAGVSDTGANIWVIVALAISLTLTFYVIERVMELFPDNVQRERIKAYDENNKNM